MSAIGILIVVFYFGIATTLAASTDPQKLPYVWRLIGTLAASLIFWGVIFMRAQRAIKKPSASTDKASNVLPDWLILGFIISISFLLTWPY